ncbi:MAG: GTP 3',8-cyclase MoaA [Cyclobacteriaceae bacterium]|nr:GTP 3',8-cyclase MoaA [Cyclobacteriaceae bacterium]
MKKKKITDKFGREITYLRLAVIDRCNLRCFYCMPEEGIQFVKKDELLSYEEMERLVRLLANLGVNKLRLTGGEPFIRRDFIAFLSRLSSIDGLDKISITTNGLLTARYIDDLKRLGITNINLSMDTLRPDVFKKITRRDEFNKVWNTLHRLVEEDFNVKINAVVMEGVNEGEINDLTGLTRDMPVSMRFIEEMPFNGSGSRNEKLKWSYSEILKEISSAYTLHRLDDTSDSTSMNYRIEGHQGTVGVIPAWSRTFCGGCNRIRITAQGEFKTCLYDHGKFSIKALMRQGMTDEKLTDTLVNMISNKYKDGFEAEDAREESISESMSTIGG